MAAAKPGGGTLPWSVPSRFGEYHLLRRLGGGGSGEVFLAEHATLGRQVALKLVHPGSVYFPEAGQRLLHEARAASKLDHPGICPVFDVGAVEGVPYLAMRFIEGETLARWIAEARRSTGLPAGGPRSRPAVLQLAALAEKVARALHAAHQAGLIHRDIKPANIMVAPGGEPVILDFGLAQLEGAQSGSGSRFGGIVGTPDYVPPEQVAGSGLAPGPGWDIYSLGVTLYEALALRTPFRAPTLEQLQKNILSGEYIPIQRLNPAVPRDLATVLATALAREPDRRYRNALDMAEELRRVQESRPILARRPGLLAKARGWARRHPYPAAFGGLLGLALGVTLFLLLRVHQLNRHNELLLTRMRARALASASAGVFPNNQKLALLLAEAGARTAVLPETLFQLQQVIGELQESAAFDHTGESLLGARISPKGDLVLTWALNGQAKLWMISGRALGAFRFHDPTLRIMDLEFSPDQSRILGRLTKGMAALWDAEGTLIAELKGPADSITQARFSPDGTRVLTLARDGTVQLWSGSGEPQAILDAPDGALTCVEFAPGGDQLATGGKDGTLRLWTAAGVPLSAWKAHTGAVKALAFSPDGSRIASSGAKHPDCTNPPARLWDRAGLRLATFDGHDGEVQGMCFSPDGTELLTRSADLTARLWALDGECRRILHGPRASIIWTEFSPAGERFLVVSLDQPVRVFDRQGRLLESLTANVDSVASGRFSPDGTCVLVAFRDGTTRLWRLGRTAVPTLDSTRTLGPRAVVSASGRWILTLNGREVLLWDGDGRPQGSLQLPDRVFCAEFSPDETRIATCGQQQDSRLWSTDGALLAVLPGGEKSHRAIHFLPTGDRLLAVELNGLPTLWSDRGTLLARWPIARITPNSQVRLSPDGERVLWVDPDKNVCISDPSGQETLKPPQEPCGISHLAWAPGGERFLATSEDGRLRLWERSGRPLADFTIEGLAKGQAAFAQGGRSLAVGLATGALALYTLEGVKLVETALHDGPITGLSLSPDGNTVLTASRDGTACLLQTTGQELLTLPGLRGPLQYALLFPDGSRALTVPEKGQGRLWRLRPEDILEQARRLAGRDFLPPERRRYAELLGG